MRRTLLAAALLATAILPAKADVILGGQNWTTAGAETLTLSAVVPGGNQPQNVVCIICGENQPQQGTFGYTDFKNNGGLDSMIMFSTNVVGGANPGNDTVGLPYSGVFLQAYLNSVNANPSTFSIGIDVNDTGSAQQLNSFYFLNLTEHRVIASYTGGAFIPSQNNGTGFPDYQLTGFQLDGSNIGDNLLFVARMSNMNDGPDSFFLTPTQVAVPGPIVGAGLPGLIAACLGLWGLQRRRKQKV